MVLSSEGGLVGLTLKQAADSVTTHEHPHTWAEDRLTPHPRPQVSTLSPLTAPSPTSATKRKAASLDGGRHHQEVRRAEPQPRVPGGANPRQSATLQSQKGT